MASVNILQSRLINQQIAHTKFTNPAELTAWQGAIQAQDFAHGKWAIGSRIQDATEEKVNNAFVNKSIVHTWSMRCTLHIVAAEDLRWMLSLLAPKIIASCASRYRNLELDNKTLNKGLSLIERAMQGGRQLTRDEIIKVLASGKIEASGIRLAHILQYAVLNQRICIGVRKEKEPSFSLLEEYLPAPTQLFNRDEALAELTTRYFTSHAPATLQDFVWWSGLTVTDAKKGIASIKSTLTEINMNGKEYFISKNATLISTSPKSIYLLSGFDEYILGYRDRSDFINAEDVRKVFTVNGIFNPVIITNGKVTAAWKRTIKKDSIKIEIAPFAGGYSKSMQRDIEKAAERYVAYTGKNLEEITLKQES